MYSEVYKKVVVQQIKVEYYNIIILWCFHYNAKFCCCQSKYGISLIVFFNEFICKILKFLMISMWLKTIFLFVTLDAAANIKNSVKFWSLFNFFKFLRKKMSNFVRKNLEKYWAKFSIVKQMHISTQSKQGAED